MADFTLSVIFLSVQHPITQPNTIQNKTKKTPLTKSPPAPSHNVVTLQKISVNGHLLHPQMAQISQIFIPLFLDALLLRKARYR